MPKGTIYQDAALTNVALGYKNADLIGSLIFPAVTVGKQSGKVYKFGKDAFRIPTTVRAPGTVSKRAQAYSVSSDTYFCDNHALHDIVPNEDKDNADAAINPEIATTEGLTDMLLLAREKSIADYLFNTTTFAGYTAAKAGTAQWSNFTNSTPVEDSEAAIELVRKKTGVTANTLVIGAEAFSKLRRHPDLLEMFKYTGVPILTEQQVAEAMRVKRVLVGKAVYNSANEGTTESMADIWGKYALFAYIAEKPELRKPSLGYSYRWNTGTQGFQVFREELGPKDGHGTFIEAMNYFDDLLLAAEFGYLYSAVIA